jgi:hypothetical protein
LGTDDPTSYLNLGAYLSEYGKQDGAIPILKTALGMNEDTEDRILTYLNLDFTDTSIADCEDRAFNSRCESMGKNFWRRLTSAEGCRCNTKFTIA